MNNKPKVSHTYYPKNKPSYNEWVKIIGIKEMAWLYHPDGKQRADSIMEGVGIPTPKTLLERLLGE